MTPAQFSEWAAMAMETFEQWWRRDGRLIDPDTEDVSWFDKRKGLAEAAFNAALAQSGNYTANDSVDATEIRFANGRRVWINESGTLSCERDGTTEIRRRAGELDAPAPAVPARDEGMPKAPACIAKPPIEMTLGDAGAIQDYANKLRAHAEALSIRQLNCHLFREHGESSGAPCKELREEMARAKSAEARLRDLQYGR